MADVVQKEVVEAPSGSIVEQIAKAGQVKRPVYRYKVPARMGEGVVTSVGLVRLTISEELAIAEAYKTGKGMQLAKACLVEVNGHPVTDADDSRDVAWAKMPPPVRNTVLVAYNKLHMPEDADVDLFLKSEEVTVA